MNCPYARVNVYFHEIIDAQENESYEIVPNSEMVVSRIAKRDNSSQYKINDRNVQFKEVASFLGTKGIDLDNNRFLILQGEVEMISMMPPKGRNNNDDGLLEYLEDIIGSNKFVEQTAEAERYVEQLAEQRQEKLHRVKAVEQEKDSLESAKQEAEALVSKDRQIRSKQNVVYQMYKNEAQRELDRDSREHQETTAQLHAEQEKYRCEQQAIADLEELYKKNKAAYDVIHAELKQTKEEFSMYERKDIKLREELKHCKKSRKALVKKQADAEEKMKASRDAIVQAKESIPILEESIQSLTQQKTERDEALHIIQEEVRETTKGLRATLEKKMKELAPIKQERTVAQTKYDTALAQVKIVEDGPASAQERYDAAATELANLDETQASKRTELATTEASIKTSERQLLDLSNEEKELASSEPIIVERHTNTMMKLEDLRTSIQASDAPRVSKAVQGILQASKAGGELANIGIIGRLGDLATIADEYDVAVSTAVSSLDHIVVKTNDAATQCLEFLRRYNLGRASFMVLDKISKGAHDRNVETPEGAPRLFDLIRPKHPSLAPAFFLAVANTLVAKDLDTATRWCYDFDKRWRVVTLDGKLLETSGTQSGGGTSCRRGRMKLEVRHSNWLVVLYRLTVDSQSGTAHMEVDGEDKDAVIQELENECANIQRELEMCRTRRKNITNESRSLKKSIRDLEAKIPKLTVEINGCDTTRQELTQLLPTLKAQTKLSDEDERKLEILRDDLQKCQDDMADCTEAASGLETEVEGLQKKIMDAGGSKLKEQEKACKATVNELNAAEKSLSSAKVSITSNEKAVKKAEGVKSKTESELEALDLQETEFKEELTSLEGNAVRVQEAFEKVKELEADASKKMNDASNECEALKSTMSNAKYIEIELLGKLEDLTKSVSQAEEKKEKWEADLAKLRAAAEEDLDDFAESDSEDEDDTDDDKTEVANNKNGDDVAMADDEHEALVVETAFVVETEEETASVRDDGQATKAKKRKPTLPVYDSEELSEFDKDKVKHDIAVLEGERNTLAKNANMGAIAEYRKKEADYLSRSVFLICFCSGLTVSLVSESLSSIKLRSYEIKPGISTKTCVGNVSRCSWMVSVKSR